MALVDEAKSVRKGEELDADRLRAYLQATLGTQPGAGTDLGPELSIRQFPGGYSNLTYLIRYGEKELVLRRPPFGSKVKSAHDMGREFRILSRLAPVYPRAPRPVAFCEDESVLGAKFYIMERIPGIILRRQLPPELDRDLTPERMRLLCDAFLDVFVELHRLDYEKIGLGDLGRPEGYVERQVTGWSKRYRDAQTDEVPPMERVISWLGAHQPPSPPATLIHNDYKFDNLILDPADPTRVIGVLDWEMATIGDPLMDLGTLLCYWLEASDPPELHMAAFGPTARPGCPTRQELVQSYAQRTGRDLSHVVFYYAFGLFKSAVVVQQIYYRFKQGLTQDPRFAMLGAMATLLAEQADRTIERGQI